MPETITLVDPDGVSHTMGSTATTTSAVLLGVEGLFSPPFDLQGEDVPLESGERISQVRAERRTLLVPFRIYAADEGALRTAVRAWVSRFNPLRGASTLRWTGPDGATRDLEVRLQGGTEGVVDERNSGFNRWFQTLVLTFRASDPWWVDTNATTRTFTTADSGGTFFPFFPMSLSSSEVFAEASVNNDGDTWAWPVWTITGPGSDPIIRNVTSGKRVDLTGVTLSAGETITVDTRPGFKTVTRSDGTNMFSSLSSASSLWRLEQGAQTVRVEMGGTSSASQVDLVYRRRWLSV